MKYAAMPAGTRMTTASTALIASNPSRNMTDDLRRLLPADEREEEDMVSTWRFGSSAMMGGANIVRAGRQGSKPDPAGRPGRRARLLAPPNMVRRRDGSKPHRFSLDFSARACENRRLR